MKGGVIPIVRISNEGQLVLGEVILPPGVGCLILSLNGMIIGWLYVSVSLK
jgi:hypothetical protein